tara:strand:- start:9153 stop:10106 length:954 start_codon:yes stop_codon:yes gene_type:complete
MKVLHLTNNYPTNRNPVFGIFVKEQIDSLIKLGVDCDVFFINGREKGKIEYLFQIINLYKHISKNDYDIIHCHHSFSALCLLLTFKGNKFKKVLSFQNSPEKEIFNFIVSIFKKKFDVLITKNKLKSNYNFYNIPNGVNINFFKKINKKDALKKTGLSKDKIYILFVSSNFVRKQKRLDIFVKVIKILKENFKIKNIDSLILTNVERHLIPYYFNAASVHLLCSDFEGSPNSVKEALSVGLPVVSTDVGNVKEMLVGLKNSYVSGSNNPQELAELVYKIIKKKSENRMEGLDRIHKLKLDINSVAQKIKIIYENIIK